MQCTPNTTKVQEEQDDEDEDEARERRRRLAAERAPELEYESVDVDALMQQRLKRKLAAITTGAAAAAAAAPPPPAKRGEAGGASAAGTEREAFAAALNCTVRACYCLCARLPVRSSRCDEQERSISRHPQSSNRIARNSQIAAQQALAMAQTEHSTSAPLLHA